MTPAPSPGEPALVFASASAYKRAELERLGLVFACDSAHIDESPMPGEAPMALARRLAASKALAVAPRHPGAFVLGGDQVIALEGEIFHKPQSVERACEQLARLQGQSHILITAIALVSPDARLFEEQVSFEMQMRPLGPQAIERYVLRDMPLDCAGSYKIEQAGIGLFKAMRGEDYTAIIGLPLTRVVRVLELAGFAPIARDLA